MKYKEQYQYAAPEVKEILFSVDNAVLQGSGVMFSLDDPYEEEEA